MVRSKSPHCRLIRCSITSNAILVSYCISFTVGSVPSVFPNPYLCAIPNSKHSVSTSCTIPTFTSRNFRVNATLFSCIYLSINGEGTDPDVGYTKLYRYRRPGGYSTFKHLDKHLNPVTYLRTVSTSRVTRLVHCRIYSQRADVFESRP